MGDDFSLEDVLIIVQRRIWYFVLPALILAPLGILVVMLLPAKYEAEGKILIESPQISDDLIGRSTDQLARERIEVIRQRVLTRNRLLEVADKYNLFDERKRISDTDRVAKMREQFKVRFIRSDPRNRRTRTDTTIAFAVSYTHKSPQKAYLATNEFMTLFLSEDVRTRTTGASNTREFFESTSAQLRNQVAAIEQRISAYKAENADALPEHLSLHLDMLERANRELTSIESSMQTMREEQSFLETQLITGVGAESSASQKLAELEAELTRLRSVYRDKHPSIQALRQEINSLRAAQAPSREILSLRRALADAEDALANLRRDSESTPQAISAATTQAEEARNALSDRIGEEARSGATDSTSLQLESRIAIIGNRIRTQNAQKDETLEKIASLEARIARTPEVERGLLSLSRDYDNVFAEYRKSLSNQQSAQLSERLEENQQAEKFTILEPASTPDRPTSPDRAKLSLLAIVAAFGIGGMAALGAEFLFATIRGRNHISSLIGGHPIAVIPYIPGENDRKRFSLPFIGSKPGAAADTQGAL